ncbi:MAG: flagellar hook-basal body complex protein FliE [Candidatus Helarchaeota archaeon]|nr:flagellar hook-basal body complex protein FliE [Candidatus Helarchaeota archaeon]
MDNLKKIQKTGIGVVGLPGSGKSIVSEVAKELGIPTIVMGDVIRQTCIDRGLEINSENVGTVMVKIREEEGMNIVAKRTLPKLSEIEKSVVIIDGLRSFEEVELFRKHLNKFFIVAIHASPRTRYARIRKRSRFDDSKNLKVIQERDFREINAGIAKIIALADVMFVNEGRINPLKRRISKILRLIKENKWR